MNNPYFIAYVVVVVIMMLITGDIVGVAIAAIAVAVITWFAYHMLIA